MRHSSKPTFKTLFILLSLLTSCPGLAGSIPTQAARPLMELVGRAGDPLVMPSDVAVDARYIYVVDGGNHRVVVFDSSTTRSALLPVMEESTWQIPAITASRSSTRRETLPAA